MRSLLLPLFLAALLVTGCSSPTMLEMNTVADKVPQEEAFSRIKGVLVSNGFDVKSEDAAAGFITTSYKKWSYTRTEGGPNGGKSKEFKVTLRMQMRVKVVKGADGKTVIQVTPAVKQLEEETETSLLDAAVTVAKLAMGKDNEEVDLGDDAQLTYYKEDDREPGIFTPDEKKTRLTMLKTFLKTSNEIATACELPRENLKYIIGN